MICTCPCPKFRNLPLPFRCRMSRFYRNWARKRLRSCISDIHQSLSRHRLRSLQHTFSAGRSFLRENLNNSLNTSLFPLSQSRVNHLRTSRCGRKSSRKTCLYTTCKTLRYHPRRRSPRCMGFRGRTLTQTTPSRKFCLYINHLRADRCSLFL